MKKNTYKYVVKVAHELSELERNSLRELTFRTQSGSHLSLLLDDIEKKLENGFKPQWPVCLALNDGSIVGWAASGMKISFPPKKARKEKRKFSNVGAYVSYSYRRKGIAFNLMKRLIRRLSYDGIVAYAYPHDSKSKAFFKKLGFYQENKDVHWLISSWRHDVV